MRRRTYDVFTVDGPPATVLAYDTEGAERFALPWCERNGYTFSHVVLKPRARKRSRTWEFDVPAIQAAMDAMGINTPMPTLENPFAPDGQSTQGYFVATPWGCTIRVYANNTPKRASETLWHELCHLAQHTRAATHTAWVQQRSAEHRMYSYARRPCEIEACEWETLAETDPLVREVS